MSYALSRPPAARRGGLLGIVVGLHGVVLLAVVAAKSVAPEVVEVPLVVDLIQPAQPEAPKQQAPAPRRPQPTPPQAIPQAPTPRLEASSSSQPAPSAPLAAPPQSQPQPAASAAPAAEAVSPARYDADYLKNPAPTYPPLARRMGEEGKVVLRVQVNAQGSADSVEIKTSSGSDRLDQAALKAVRSWRFVAARRGGEALASAVLVPITFKLEQ